MSATTGVPPGTLRILIVDDETIVRDSLAAWFRQDGHQVDVAEGGKDALRLVSASRYDMAFLDIKMPGMDGLEVLRRVRETSPETTVIIMTAYASVETAIQALKDGAYDYIVKPFDPEAISRLVKKAAERYTLDFDRPQSIGRVRAFYGNFANLVRGYTYIPPGGTWDDRIALLASDVAHVKLPNPGDEYGGMGKGLSPIAPLAQSGDVDNAASVRNAPTGRNVPNAASARNVPNARRVARRRSGPSVASVPSAVNAAAVAAPEPGRRKRRQGTGTERQEDAARAPSTRHDAPSPD